MSTNVTDPTTFPAINLPAPADPSSVSIVRLLAILWARKFFILVVAACLVCVAGWLILRMPDAYVANASVIIGSRDSVGDPSLSDSKMAATTDSVAIRTQVDLLKSFSLAKQVATELHLVEHAPSSPTPSPPRSQSAAGSSRGLRSMLGRVDAPPLGCRVDAGPGDGNPAVQDGVHQ